MTKSTNIDQHRPKWPTSTNMTKMTNIVFVTKRNTKDSFSFLFDCVNFAMVHPCFTRMLFMKQIWIDRKLFQRLLNEYQYSVIFLLSYIWVSIFSLIMTKVKVLFSLFSSPHFTCTPLINKDCRMRIANISIAYNSILSSQVSTETDHR